MGHVGVRARHMGAGGEWGTVRGMAGSGIGHYGYGTLRSKRALSLAFMCVNGRAVLRPTFFCMQMRFGCAWPCQVFQAEGLDGCGGCPVCAD